MSLALVGLGAGLVFLLMAGRSSNDGTTNGGWTRPAGGPLRAFDTARLGRRGNYEYLVVYTPDQAENLAFSLLGYPIGGDPTDPTSDWGSFNTPEEAEASAVYQIDQRSAEEPPAVTALVPPLGSLPGAQNEESRLVSDGDDGTWRWEIYYVDDAPQPWIFLLGPLGGATQIMGTAAGPTQAKAAIEELITTHRNSLGNP